MRIGILYAGPFGEQIINHISLSGFGGQIVAVYELTPEKIPGGGRSEDIWESPDDFLPLDLPEVRCDLLLVLGVQGSLGVLVPGVAKRWSARAVIFAIDDRGMAPDARRSIEEELGDAGIHVEFPEPFCNLSESRNDLIRTFAERFGRPEFRATIDPASRCIQEVTVLRDTPCGTASSAAKKLEGLPCEEDLILRRCYEEHHNEGAEHCCLAEMDPLYPVMQEAGDLLKDAVFAACSLPTTKDLILRILAETGGISIDDLKARIVSPQARRESEMCGCTAGRTVDLYLEELGEAEKVERIGSGRVRIRK
jgi:thymidylate synthase